MMLLYRAPVNTWFSSGSQKDRAEQTLLLIPSSQPKAHRFHNGAGQYSLKNLPGSARQQIEYARESLAQRLHLASIFINANDLNGFSVFGEQNDLIVRTEIVCRSNR